MDIDESLYSRQLYVLGHEAMRRMASSNILISGMNGLGVEIAKNVILGGVKSVTLHSEKECSIQDLSSQFYLGEKDIGKNCAEATKPHLMELNSYVQVSSHTSTIMNDQFLRNFSVIVLAESSYEEIEKIAVYARNNQAALIVASTCGLFGQTLDRFKSTHNRPPMPWHDGEAAEFNSLAQQIAKNNGYNIDKKVSNGQLLLIDFCINNRCYKSSI